MITMMLMKNKYFKHLILNTILVFLGFLGSNINWANAQILNPNDPVTIYNPNSPPTYPNYNTIGKWVITPTVSWNSNQFKPYVYNDMAFRLAYPTSYKSGVADGKSYPLIIFLHGAGEYGTIYNNDKQLYWGGQPTLSAISSGVDAFFMFPQNNGGTWGPTYYQYLNSIISYMVQNAKVDPQRIIIYGLSAGGQGTWDILDTYPKVAAGAIMFSAANYVYNAGIPGYRFTPIWLAQGGLDTDPLPSTANSLVNNIQAAGGNILYSYFPNDGHGTWNDMWANPDFFPWMLRQNKANPWALHGQTTFCSANGISDTLGLTPGFNSYQWMYNGTVISGANSNTYVATKTGTYSARYLNGSTWSSWSPTPVVVTINTPTITPPIQLASTESNVIPALDGSTSVLLTVPGTFTSYSWVKAGTTTVLGTGATYLATSPGNYQCTVTQQFSCSTVPSPVYTVVSASGTGAPAAISNLTTSAASTTSLNVNWNYTPGANAATGFELYRATSRSGPYTFMALIPYGTNTYLDQNLSASLTYYYEMRAVNGSGASATSGPVVGLTVKDITPPSVPSGIVLYLGSSTANLTWTASTDNVAVAGYYVLINGVKNYTTTNTSISLYNLNEGQSYSISVEAFDAAGNISTPSTPSVANMYDGGFNYKFFTLPGNWTVFQDLNALNPVAYGNSPSLDLTKATQSSNYAFLWTGTLHIPVTGSYTFVLNSVDGSQVFIDEPYDYTITPTINNDGIHGNQSAQVTLSLTKGEHKIAIAYFHGTSAASMSLSWKNTANGVGASGQIIPNAIFALQNPDNTTTAPTAPSSLTGADNVSGESLRWSDAGTNNIGYNIYRSLNGANNFTLLNSSPVNALSYLDNTALGNSTYQYYVNAVNPFGTSANSNTFTLSTNNKIPVLTPVVNPTWQVSTTDSLVLSATPRSGTSLTLSVTGLSASARFTDKGNGTGVLYMNPVTGDIGTHNLVFKAVDAFGGTSTESFTITIKAAVNPFIPNPPTNLTAHGGSISSVTLNWVVSANTNLFYIYQAPSATGPWKLIDSVSGNISTYLNSGLNSNTSYFYQLKSKNASGLSIAGNIAYATTLQYVTQLQFNTDYPAGFPWNHVNATPIAGLTISNLSTTTGNNSGINVTMTNSFDGTNVLGAVTGNNSGIYPDYVIRGQFYVQTPDTAILTVSGLSSNMSYDFIFFNSWANPFAGGITSYVINGKMVNLDPTNNNSKTVQINNVLADQYGNIKITIKPAAGQTFGIISALTIQSHQIPPSLQNVAVAIGKFIASAAPVKQPVISTSPEITAYPVPFTNAFTIHFNSETTGNYKVRILNVQGQVLYDEPGQAIQIGSNDKNLNDAVARLAKGLYLIQVQSDTMPEKGFLVNKN